MGKLLLNYCGGGLLRRHSVSDQAVASATVLIRSLAGRLAFRLPRYVQKQFAWSRKLVNYCGGGLLRRHSVSVQAVACATVLTRSLAGCLAYLGAPKALYNLSANLDAPVGVPARHTDPRYVQKQFAWSRKLVNYCGGGLLRCGRWVVFGLAGFLLVGFLAACSTAPDTKAETEVMIQRQQAVDYASQGDQNMVSRNFAQAEVFYQQSLQANWATDNLAGVIQAHFSLGFLYLGLGFADRADEEYVGAAEAAAMLGDPGLIADCQLNRAKIELWRSQPQAALDRLEAASKALGRDANDQDGGRRATFLHNRGQALKDLGRMTEAKADLTAALAINLKNKRLKEPAANLYLLASIANRENKLDEALDLAGRALTLDKQAENSEGIAKDLYAMATLLQKYPGKDGQPRLTEAWDLLRRSYRVSLATNDAVAVERDLVLLQELAGKLGLVEEQSRYAAAAAKLKASQAAAAKGGTGAAGPTATPSPSPSTGKVK